GMVRCDGCSHAMRPQAQGRGLRIYRCMKRSAGGTCLETSVIAQERLDGFVLAQFLAHIEAEADQVAADETESLVVAVVEAENAYRSVLDDSELARQLGPADHGRMVAAYHANWQDALAAIPD